MQENIKLMNEFNANSGKYKNVEKVMKQQSHVFKIFIEKKEQLINQ